MTSTFTAAAHCAGWRPSAAGLVAFVQARCLHAPFGCCLMWVYFACLPFVQAAHTTTFANMCTQLLRQDRCVCTLQQLHAFSLTVAPCCPLLPCCIVVCGRPSASVPWPTCLHARGHWEGVDRCCGGLWCPWWCSDFDDSTCVLFYWCHTGSGHVCAWVPDNFWRPPWPEQKSVLDWLASLHAPTPLYYHTRVEAMSLLTLPLKACNHPSSFGAAFGVLSRSHCVGVLFMVLG
jgi:hypothetical protein